jgi:hypothetical protein
MKFEKLEFVEMKKEPELNEKWVQAQIHADPSLLGLGDLRVRATERKEPRGGRLDLLLEDEAEARRYAVELQLGALDESHIIRTIEYWDIEQRRNPKYEHLAVIIAEDITSRFLNVINLLNGAIPLVAIQVKCVKLGSGSYGLLFTKVLDESRTMVEEEEDPAGVTDRQEWEKASTSEMVKLVDRLLDVIHQFEPKYELKYNMHYIGLAENGIANNFVLFRPKKKHVVAEVKMPFSTTLEAEIENEGLEISSYSHQWGRFKIKITNEIFLAKQTYLRSLFERARKQPPF